MIGSHIHCTLKTPLELFKTRRRVATRVSRPPVSLPPCRSPLQRIFLFFRLAFPLKILRILLNGGYIGRRSLHILPTGNHVCVQDATTSSTSVEHRWIRLLNWRVALRAHLSTLDDLFTPASRSSMVGRPRQRSGQLNLVPFRPCRYQVTDDQITQATGIARRLATA